MVSTGSYQTTVGPDGDPRPIIQVRNVTNCFGSHVVHQNLDLDVRHGEILGVVGGSGSGKSVLLRTIVGLHKSQTGAVHLLGQDILNLSGAARSAIERRFGVLFQRGALFSSLTLLENIALPLIEHSGLSRTEATDIAHLKIALVGLPARSGSQYPSSLSGGMIKRAALARALALDPDILFLDEPTAGLDPIGAGAFDELIVTLRNALGLTVFLVTHDLDTLYTICNRVAVLANKCVQVVGELPVVENYNDPWIHSYFQGPRGRAAWLASHHNTESH